MKTPCTATTALMRSLLNALSRLVAHGRTMRLSATSNDGGMVLVGGRRNAMKL